jgi:predicted dithiol-disulfide oxidoreductase (DUF899 family)
LLADEIEFRRHMTRRAERRRGLPLGPVITKDYLFKDEQPLEVGLKDLFGDKDTLVLGERHELRDGRSRSGPREHLTLHRSGPCST